MKAITLSATTLILLGTLTLGIADEISVDAQITAIQEAPAQERVQLMNQFKTRLTTMNESEREAAITQLRTQIQTQTQARLNEGAAEGEQLQTQTHKRLNEGEADTEAAIEKTRTMTQERSRVNEMQQTQQMQQVQQTQQMQQAQQMQQQVQDQIGQHVGGTVPTPNPTPTPNGLGQ